MEGKVSIVTGAGGHLGGGITKALLSAGSQVIVLGRNKNTLKELIDKNKEYEEKITFYICDVTDENLFIEIVDDVISSFGKIDVLVNNAYGKQNEDFKNLSKDLWYKALESSMTHYFTCTRAVSKFFLKKESGSIINIASLYGFLGTDQRTYKPIGSITPLHYSVAKGGVLQMTRYFATLWAENGIRVNSISPGVFPPKKGPEKPDYMRELTSRVPMGRIGRPDDLAGAIILLASSASSYITGQNIVVDGGWSVW
jgi:gluconate 5-dehydrogenase